MIELKTKRDVKNEMLIFNEMLKTMKIRALGQIESGRRKAGVLFFLLKNLGHTLQSGQ